MIPRIPISLLRASLRDMLRRPGQTLLSLLGIALGVAVVVAVDLANQSATRGMALSMQALDGAATHRVISSTGGLRDVDYRRLRVEFGVRSSTPLVEGTARLGGETFTLLGIDPLSSADFRGGSIRLGRGDLARLLTEPGGLLVSAPTLARLKRKVGDRLRLRVAGAVRPATIVGAVESDQPASLDGILITDIASAQELLGKLGRLDRIELILPRDQSPPALPAGLSLEPIHSERDARTQMTRAFHTNLTAMSLLAMLVGALLVYNTMTFSVLRRRRLLGLMRSLGVTREGVLWLVLAEALLLGLVGSALGLALGIALAQGLLGLVTRAINDIYFSLQVNTLWLSPWGLAKGFGLGLAVSLLAAALPAREAASTSPHAATRRSDPELGAIRAAPRWALYGISAMTVGLLGLWLLETNLAVAFALLFLVVIGYALTLPLTLLWLSRRATAPIGRLFGTAGRFAMRSVGAGLTRTGIAVAALTVAVSSAVGVGIMVESFRVTVSDWIGQTLVSDIYVSVPADSGTHKGLPRDLLRELPRLPGVATLSKGLSTELRTGLGSIPALVLNDAPQVRDGIRLLRSTQDDPWQALRAGKAVFVSEALASKFKLAPGDALELETTQGGRQFTVAAVFRDYSSDRGVIFIDRATFVAHWRDERVSTAGIRLKPNADLTHFKQRLRALIATQDQSLLMRSAAEIRAESMAVFDRTFAITAVLRVLALGVAFIGMLSALLALMLERAREQATLRALGMTPAQLTGLIGLECGFMGLVAGLAALPLGWLLAQLLMHVINRLSFGWSMQGTLPTGVLVESVGLAVIAALLAGLYPAWRLARTRTAQVLREE